MEVHHHSHTPRKKWTHYLWEFLMLFFAVFCGFLAELQLEHYIEHQREKQYAKSLYDDFRVDTMVIQRTINEKIWIKEKYDSALSVLKAGQIEQHNEFLYFVERYLAYNDVFTSQDVTFQQMRSSGSFRYFKDLDLYKKIADYYSLYSRYQSVDGNFAGFDKRHGLVEFESTLFNPVDLANLDNYAGRNFYELALPANKKLERIKSDEKGLKEFYIRISNESIRTGGAELFLHWLFDKATTILQELKKKYHLK